VKLKQGSNS